MRTRGISNRQGTQRRSHSKKKTLHPKPLGSKGPSSPLKKKKKKKKKKKQKREE
jgi:hypothetical protein